MIKILFHLAVAAALVYAIVTVVISTTDRVQSNVSEKAPETPTTTPSLILPSHDVVRDYASALLHPAKPKTSPGQPATNPGSEVRVRHGLPVCTDLAAATKEQISKIAVTGDYKERTVEPSGRRCIDLR